MIDPQRLGPSMDLEEYLLFCIVVGGKPAQQQARKLATLLDCVMAPQSASMTPLHRVALMEHEGVLEQNLRAVGMGQYTRILAAIRALIHRRPRLDLRTCTVEDLESIPGIGPKTARFFILHSRPGARVAALDTHVLKFLKAYGVSDIPDSTPPSGLKYRTLERAFLEICDRLKVDPATMDLAVWNSLSRGGTGESIVLTS